MFTFLVFIKQPGLNSIQINAYQGDFSRFDEIEVLGFEETVKEAMKNVVTDKTPDFDGLPYKEYLRLSYMIVLLLTLIFDSWVRLGAIPQYRTRGAAKLHPKNLARMRLVIFDL